MFANLQNTINFARPFIQYAPVTAGFGNEPAVSIASMIRNSLLNPPMTWYYNRAQFTFNTVQGTQDYLEQIPDLAFVEKVSLTDDQGNIIEVKDIYNSAALAVSSFQQRPNAMSVEERSFTTPFTMTVSHVTVASNVLTVSTSNTFGLDAGDQVTFDTISDATFLNGQTVTVTGVTPNTSFTAVFNHSNYNNANTGNATTEPEQQFNFRFLGVPDQVYVVTLVYQKMATQFGPFFIASVDAASGGVTAYHGSFETLSFPVGAVAIISGFTSPSTANNGSFAVVSCTASTLIVKNAAGVVVTAQGFASNFSWDPIPNQYSDIYNNLFLSEILALADDPRAQLYRQRGVAAFMSKAAGLSEMQKNIFMQQWLARNTERASVSGREQLGNAGRGV